MLKKIGIGLIGILLIGGVVFFLMNNNGSKRKKEKNTTNQYEILEVKNSMFKDGYEKAMNTLEKMTIEEKVGQLFLVRYNKEDAKTFRPGGYILFAKDFENHTKDSIKKEIENVQSLNKYPLIIGVDEEGGYVTRVSRYPAFRSEKFASPKYYYDTGGYSLLEKMETEKATLLKSIGINLNLAPVADISTDENDFIYSRSLGKDAKTTAEIIKNMVEYANSNHLNSCLKHFPGYGNNKDTHTGIAIDERSYSSFVEKDYLPFEAGIEASVPSILVSHNIVKAIDSEYPSSLSSKVIKELRNTLNYTGIIMTDDLAMDAVKEYVEDGRAATMAMNAGNDMIITSDFPSMQEEVLNSLKEGIISEETINQAVARILAWKYYSNLF